MAPSPILIFSLLAITLIITAISLKIESNAPLSSSNEEILIDKKVELAKSESKPLKLSDRAKLTSWSNCSSNNDIILQELQYSPDPIWIPGKLYVGFRSIVAQNLTKIPVSVQAYRKVLGVWIKLPCENQMGSCNYADGCDNLPPVSQCPESFINNNIPCSCPIDAGSYYLPLSYLIDLDTLPIPKWLESGDYRVTVQAYSEDSQTTLLCVRLFFTIKTQ